MSEIPTWKMKEIEKNCKYDKDGNLLINIDPNLTIEEITDRLLKLLT